MGKLVDFQIRSLSTTGYPLTWSPSSGEYTGLELPIHNPGPLISDFDARYLGPASYDIATNSKFSSPSGLHVNILRDGSFVKSFMCNYDLDGSDYINKKNRECIEILLAPKQVILCCSEEYFRIPPNLVGTLTMRSSPARDWLDHSNASDIWPGFQGQITFELRNDGIEIYKLRSGERHLQISFGRTDAVPENPYNGVYQNQVGQLHALKRDKE
jgi:deoxycytidine triphosphate deaminase